MDAIKRLKGKKSHCISLCNRKGNIEKYSYDKLSTDVEHLISELSASGIKARDTVGIIGDNSYEWVLIDLALLSMDCVSVALPTEMLLEKDTNQLTDQYQLVAILAASVPKKVIRKILSPHAVMVSQRPIHLIKRDVREQNFAAEIFTVTFSSGTTGNKKGVLMTKRGIANTINISAQAWNVDIQDNILLVMPFSNFQQRYLLYLAISCGCNVSLVAPERMFQKLPDIRPTIMVGPPSFYEFLENKLGHERQQLRWRFAVSALLNWMPYRFKQSFRWKLFESSNRLYGDKIRLMFVGSAPVKPTTVATLQSVGLPLFEAYGLTEFGWISFNLPQKHKVGSTGPLAPGVQVHFSDEQELMVSCSHPQSTGYVYNDPVHQNEVFISATQLATGDLGEMDDRGFLRLKGRKKNILVTRSGVKINPEMMELFIEQGSVAPKVMVFQREGDSLLSCFAWLDDPLSSKDTEQIQNFIRDFNKGSAAGQSIGKVIFKEIKELSAENGLLTRNLKLNRNKILKYYAS